MSRLLIPTYKAEKEAGLTDLIRSSGSIAYASAIEQHLTLPASSDLAKSIAKEYGLEEQIDLFPLKSILATVGWNKNDDVFNKVEVWIARATPEDKPFNLEHDPNRIRGHITGTYTVDDKGNVIADDSSIDDLPAKYHVITAAVLYKFLKCPDEKIEEEMKQIIAEIGKGEWFVSMEALFTDFDYAVAKDGETAIIARNEESAFLTKHLRAYGGDGKYENYRLGRSMKNITFSGKGLVRKPANPESIIFANQIETFSPSSKEFPSSEKSMGYSILNANASNKESYLMANEIELLQNQIKSLEASVTAANNKNNEYEKRLAELNEKQVQARISDLETQIKARDEKVAAVTAQVQTEQTARADVEKKFKETSEKYTALEKEVDTLKASQAKTARVNAWVEHTGHEMSLASKLVDNFVKLSDEEFKNVLESQPAKAAVNTPPPPVKTEVLDKAVPEPKPAALSTGGVDSGAEGLRQLLGEHIGKRYLKIGKKVTKE